MSSEAQWARRRMVYAGVAPLLMFRSGAIGHALSRAQRERGSAYDKFRQNYSGANGGEEPAAAERLYAR
jgi:hypothetical protein